MRDQFVMLKDGEKIFECDWVLVPKLIELIQDDYNNHVVEVAEKFLSKKPLTSEQLRANAEVREQISSLEHNIKLRKQDVEHAQILIANYEGRVKELESKIVEEV